MSRLGHHMAFGTTSTTAPVRNRQARQIGTEATAIRLDRSLRKPPHILLIRGPTPSVDDDLPTLQHRSHITGYVTNPISITTPLYQPLRTNPPQTTRKIIHPPPCSSAPQKNATPAAHTNDNAVSDFSMYSGAAPLTGTTVAVAVAVEAVRSNMSAK